MTEGLPVPNQTVRHVAEPDEDHARDSRWAEIVGPCYTSDSLQEVLGIGPTALLDWVTKLRILRLVTADGWDLYPAFQVSNGAIVPGMREVLTTLQRGTNDRWMWALWLNTPVRDYSSEPTQGVLRRSNIERLIAGEVNTVVLNAEHDAAGWAQ